MAGENEEKVTTFKLRYVICGIALLLFLLSIFSYNKADLAVLDGGSAEPLRNWVGPLGANISRALFYIFGLAVYPVTSLLIICLARGFIPYPLKRRGYIMALCVTILGIVILLALFPQEFILHTERLGIGHSGKPAFALSGGALGALIAAPETENISAGILRRCIGTIGTMVTALCLIFSGLFWIFMQDWKNMIFDAIRGTSAGGTGKQRRKEREPMFEEENPETGEKVRKQKYRPEFEQSEKPEDGGEETPEPDKTVKRSLFGFIKNKPADQEAEEELPPETEENFKELPPVPPQHRSYTDSLDATDRHTPERDDAFADDRMRPPQVTRSQMQKRQAPPMQSANPANYNLPPVPLLDKPKDVKNEDDEHLKQASAILQATLDSFEINGRVADTVVGPRITRFDIQLEPGVKVEKVSNIQNNIAMEMSAESIRILAPIPGRNAVGIELPNKVSNMVFIRELFESEAWRGSKADIPIILGKDVSGKVMIADLAKAPHLLIAGSTGSGKSVCMNTLIMSLLFKFSPFDLKLILVDPKFVELEMYRPLPHLITPVVNDPKKVPFALRWGVNEMEHRYQMLAKVKAKNLNAFNSRPPDPEPVYDENDDLIPPKLPLLVIIVDELADIMMTEAKSDVETSICRIAQKGRAAGIHLVIATQTPRKDIITGTIKANLPTKIAFKVSTVMDSRVILDAMGAEKLLGKGDMLFKGPSGETDRIQGSMVSDPEIQKVVDFVSSQVEQHFDTKVVLEKPEEEEDEPDDGKNSFAEEEFDDDATGDYVKMVIAKYLQPGDDENLKKALDIIIRESKASTSYLQRRMGIGYNKAAEIIDKLEQRGIVSAPLPGGQKRDILVFDELGKPD